MEKLKEEQLVKGDLITAYSPGYHIVMTADSPGPGSPQVTMTTVVDKSGNLTVGNRRIKEKSCGLAWCHKLTKEEIKIKIAEYEYLTGFFKIHLARL